MRGLKDKVVIVTGGAGGMGAAICRRFVEEGARLALFDANEEQAKRVASELQALAGAHPVHVEVVDIVDADAVEQAVANAEAALGPIDILVNNAGWDRYRRFLDTDRALREKVVAINLFGPINMHYSVLGRMSARGRGVVVNVASDAGRVGSSGQAVYSACKGGIIAFTKTMARELVRKGVRLNCVCPGPTDTPMMRAFLDEGDQGRKVFDALGKAIPMGRMGQPDDIPGAVAFFASDDAAFMTGQVVSVSGGLTMHG